jgi:mRNA interferase MazF
VKRGDLITITRNPGYAGKPRPAVIIRGSLLDATGSFTVCPLTTTDAGRRGVRIPIANIATTGLSLPSFVMIDQITTLPRSETGLRIGKLTRNQMREVRTALRTFLELAD